MIELFRSSSTAPPLPIINIFLSLLGGGRRYLECGEHDAMLSVLNAGVHQVFDQADLGSQVPDSEDQKKNNNLT